MSIFDFSYEFPSTIEELDKFNGKDFEVFLFEFFKALGHKSRLTDDTYDKGIDLIVEVKNEDKIKRVGIQAKRWKSKVGANEIRSMLDGRDHYNLDEVWIVTTSHLTSAAITTAMNNRIEIINRERVKQFLVELSKIENIRFRKIKTKVVKPSETKVENSKNDDMFEELRTLRLEIAKKHKINPVYLVYNNATLEDLIDKKPKTVEELKKVKGFTDNNIETFGNEVIIFFKSKINSIDELRKELIDTRRKIASFNKLKNEFAAFNDVSLQELIKLMPVTKEELIKVKGMDKKKVELFGEYLVKTIAFLKSKYNL